MGQKPPPTGLESLVLVTETTITEREKQGGKREGAQAGTRVLQPQPGTAAHASNHSTKEVKVARLGVQGQPRLGSRYRMSLRSVQLHETLDSKAAAFQRAKENRNMDCELVDGYDRRSGLG